MTLLRSALRAATLPRRALGCFALAGLLLLAGRAEAVNCAKSGKTAHHMIPNGTLRDLQTKLRNDVGAKKTKALSIVAAFLVATKNRNFCKEHKADCDAKKLTKATLAKIYKRWEEETAIFSMLPMNLVDGPTAECRTDDVHEATALDTLLTQQGPSYHSPCAIVLRDLGPAVKAYASNSTDENLAALHTKLKNHWGTFYKYATTQQGFARSMWSVDKTKQATVARFHARVTGDGPNNVIDNTVSNNPDKPLTACWTTGDEMMDISPLLSDL